MTSFSEPTCERDEAEPPGAGGDAAGSTRRSLGPAVMANRAGVTMGDKVPMACDVDRPRERRCGPLAGFLSTGGSG